MSFPNFKDKCFEQALFSSQDYVTWSKNIKEIKKNKPKKYIFVYYPYLLDYFKRKYKPKVIKLWRLITIYQYNDIAMVHFKGIGSPYAVTVLEEIIALGGEEFLNIGSCGGLDDFGIFLCKKALRDEGTSYHYLSKSKFAYPNRELTKRFKENLEKNNFNFNLGINWTMDAPYRETIAEIKKYKQEGIVTVDMEASALFSVAQYRKVKIASCFVVSDILGQDKWDPQFDSKHVKKKLKKLIDVAVETFS